MKSNYIKESFFELVNKVSWPKWNALQSSAILVMITSMIFALIILVMDSSFKEIMSSIYSILY